MSWFRKARDWVVRDLGLTDHNGWRRVAPPPSASGKQVTAQNALTLSTVWGCTRLVTGTMSSLPIDVHREVSPGKKVLAKDHWLYDLLHFSPNRDQSALDFWQFLNVSLELWGNGYARKERIGNRIVALTPVRPELVTARRNERGLIEYRYVDNGKAVVLGQEDMFHLRGFGGSPLGGMSTLAFGRQSFGLALATDEAAAQVYKNGIRPSGVVTQKDGKFFTAEQRETIYEHVLDKFAGDNNGRPLMLEGGLDWTTLSISAVDAQMIQSRQFSVEDCCRWFGVPPHMIGHTSNSTSWGAGLEQQTLGFLVFTLRERLKRIEQAIAKQLLTAAERQTLSISFNIEGLLRADSAARSAFYSVMVSNGIMTRNEVRLLENLPPVEGGDVLTIQSNMIPTDLLGDVMSTGEAAKNALLNWLGHNGGPALKD